MISKVKAQNDINDGRDAVKQKWRQSHGKQQQWPRCGTMEMISQAEKNGGIHGDTGQWKLERRHVVTNIFEEEQDNGGRIISTG